VICQAEMRRTARWAKPATRPVTSGIRRAVLVMTQAVGRVTQAVGRVTQAVGRVTQAVGRVMAGRGS
jgi:hypothetical protein